MRSSTLSETRHRRLHVEPLEERRLLSVGTVSSSFGLSNADIFAFLEALAQRGTALFEPAATSSTGNSSVGDLVWEDADRNGLQDPGEPGIEGVTVELYTPAGDEDDFTDDTLVATTTTDASGGYLFSNLGEGDYYLRFYAPDGFRFTYQDAGDDALDSDVYAVAGITEPFHLDGTASDHTIDAGLVDGFPPPRDLGVVDYLELLDQAPDLGQLHYQFVAARDGLASVAVQEYSGSLTIAILDQQGNLLGGTADEDQVDVEVSAGQRLFVAIAGLTSPADVILGNLLQFDSLFPGRIYVFGTTGDDRFTVDAEAPRSLQINRLQYTEDAGEASVPPQVFVTGMGGRDSAEWFGTSGPDMALVTPYFAGGVLGIDSVDHMSLVLFTAIEELSFDSRGGPDRMEIEGAMPDVAESLEMGPGTAHWTADWFELNAQNVEMISASASGGDNDTLEMTAENDQAEFHFQVWDGESNARLRGHTDSGSDYRMEGSNFRWIYADSDGDDEAEIRGTPGVTDQLKAQSDRAIFFAGSTATCFVSTTFDLEVYGNREDLAKLYDSPGDDHYEGDPDGGTFTWDVAGTPEIEIEGFGTMALYADVGYDTATLSDGGPGHNDTFISKAAAQANGQPHYARLFGPGYRYRVNGFEEVVAQASGDHGDRAYLYDHEGDEQFQFYAAPGPGESTALFGTRPDGQYVYNSARNFRAVRAYSTAGGTDTAELHDSPTTTERFYAAPDWAVMQGPGTYCRVNGFEQVSGFATGAGVGDLAFLYDGAGDDHFVGRPDYAQITYGGDPAHFAYAEGFRWVKTHARVNGHGNDTAELYGVAGGFDKLLLSLQGKYALLVGPSRYLEVKYYETNQVYGNTADTDWAYAWDSAGDDLLTADGAVDPSKATLQSVDQLFELYHFAYVKAVSSKGGTDTKDIRNPALLDYVLEAVGNWQTP